MPCIGLSDAQLRDCAKASFIYSSCPPELKSKALAEIDAWYDAGEPPQRTPSKSYRSSQSKVKGRDKERNQVLQPSGRTSAGGGSRSDGSSKKHQRRPLEQPPECLAGHKMTLANGDERGWFSSTNGWVCDKCSVAEGNTELRWTCDTCQYDLCKKCVTQSRTGATSEQE